MKTLALLFMPLLGFAQDQSLNRTEIIELPNAKQDELYSNGQAWFAESFVDANSVLQVEDRENGNLIGKGVIDFSTSGMGAADVKGAIRFTVSVSVKDGRYKYEFKDFTHAAYASSGYSFGDLSASAMPKGIPKFYNKDWLSAKAMVESKVDTLIQSLNDAMRKSNDW